MCDLSESDCVKTDCFYFPNSQKGEMPCLVCNDSSEFKNTGAGGTCETCQFGSLAVCQPPCDACLAAPQRYSFWEPEKEIKTMIVVPTTLTPEQAKQLSDLLNKWVKAMKKLGMDLGIDFFKDKQHQQN